MSSAGFKELSAGVVVVGNCAGATVAEQGIGVLWATHLFDEIAASDDLVVLHHGHVLAQGPVTQILGETGAANFDMAFRSMTEAADRRGRSL